MTASVWNQQRGRPIQDRQPRAVTAARPACSVLIYVLLHPVTVGGDANDDDRAEDTERDQDPPDPARFVPRVALEREQESDEHDEGRAGKALDESVTVFHVRDSTCGRA